MHFRNFCDIILCRKVGEIMNVGKLILKRRTELGLTLEEVGKAVGVSKSTVKKWEDGYISNMKRDKIAQLAAVLQVNPVSFITEEEWDKAAEEFEKESQNDAKMLMNYLSKLFDDAESVRIAYELIISLARLNRNGLLELSKMLDIFSRADEYKSDSLKEVEKLNEI